MSSIINIAMKDLKQTFRDWKSFLFLLIMPIAFTFLFGFAFSGSSDKKQDLRLPVGIVNYDNQSLIGQNLESNLNSSNVIKLQSGDEETLITQVTKKDLVATLIIPAGYGDSLKSENPLQLILWVDSASSDGMGVQTEIGMQAKRLGSAVLTAKILSPESGISFDQVFKNTLQEWDNPPVALSQSTKISQTIETQTVETTENNFTHSSPGMILQFAIAGLITCAQVIVSERKNNCLKRLMTTSASRAQVLLGHYLSVLLTIFAQFSLLILFGALVLKLNYFSQPLAILLVAVTASLCIAALGLLIGVVAKSEEQAIGFSLICMFLFSGLGGAWVPLEFTGETFQAIGHFTPIAWAMDGFKNVLARGLGLESAWLPAAALLGYAIVFFIVANWKFKTE
ncbi:MAG: ABC transporter permease [Anaerolineaceae bacterium]|nr:ABC transporter permease [Anaerolineaceae bacterium]